jgi:hypothetical protein
MHLNVIGWIVDLWLPRLLEIANTRGGLGDGVNGRLRDELSAIVDGSFETGDVVLPPVAVRVTGGRAALVPVGALATLPVRQTRDERARWAEAHEADLQAAVAALAADRRARRLRLCAQCDAFFVAKADHRRAHSFCSDRCRQLFDHAHRDPKAQATYMRTYRKTLKRRRRG